MSNLADAVFEHAAEDPTRVAVRAGDNTVTYGELRDLVASYAAKVVDAGVRPGDRVVLIAPTGAEFVAAYYGLHAAGAVLITMNVMATAPEIDYVLADADASLVVAWHESAGAAAKAASDRGLPLWTLVAARRVVRGRSAGGACRPGRQRHGDHHLHLGHDRTAQGRRARGRRDLRARRRGPAASRLRPRDRPCRDGAPSLPRLRAADRPAHLDLAGRPGLAAAPLRPEPDARDDPRPPADHRLRGAGHVDRDAPRRRRLATRGLRPAPARLVGRRVPAGGGDPRLPGALRRADPRGLRPQRDLGLGHLDAPRPGAEGRRRRPRRTRHAARDPRPRGPCPSRPARSARCGSAARS